MKILALSDIEVSFVYNPVAALRFQDVGMVIGCGDLSYIYIEHLVNLLGVPTYFVRGNHAKPVEMSLGVRRTSPWGAKDLHQQVVRDHSGLLMAGIEGSIRYNNGKYQYTQGEMWWMVFRLVPQMILNKSRYGRFLDLFVTHAPPWSIHDKEDHPHQGIKSFLWLDRVFQPLVHFHGHVHIYSPLTRTTTQYHNTQIINVFRYREQELLLEGKNARPVLVSEGG